MFERQSKKKKNNKVVSRQSDILSASTVKENNDMEQNNRTGHKSREKTHKDTYLWHWTQGLPSDWRTGGFELVTERGGRSWKLTGMPALSALHVVLKLTWHSSGQSCLIWAQWNTTLSCLNLNLLEPAVGDCYFVKPLVSGQQGEKKTHERGKVSEKSDGLTGLGGASLDGLGVDT